MGDMGCRFSEHYMGQKIRNTRVRTLAWYSRRKRRHVMEMVTSLRHNCWENSHGIEHAVYDEGKHNGLTGACSRC
jgi:hypothetical protein